jgi:bifunctional enzyme CysN/CysC
MTAQNSHTAVLRFITCGSVDDGKSTLIGRLLALTGNLYQDQLQALERDSARFGTQGSAIDYALALDGLMAEREQGITIDVAYRFFATEKRKFIVADCPGHEQYTRNMATGASQAEAAVVLVDARKGILPQTLRHSAIVHLFGVRHIILAINKMDAVDYDAARFFALLSEYQTRAAALGIQAISAVPISALHGDNMIANSTSMPWYTGLSLLQLLEQLEVPQPSRAALRLPVQLVLRPHQDFRGICGSLVSGSISVGQQLMINSDATHPVRVQTLTRAGQAVQRAKSGDAVLLTLAEERDIARGDVLSALDAKPDSSERFAATLLWMHEQSAQPGQRFVLKIGSRSVAAYLDELNALLDPASGQLLPFAQTAALSCNAICTCTLRLDTPIVLALFADCPALGAFVLIDRYSNATLAAGVITSLQAPRDITRHPALVSSAERAQQKRQRPRCYWLTGLSGAGKSTLAAALDRKLTDAGQHCTILDGDNVRHGLTKHLGFSEADRQENIRLVAETAKLMVEAGLVVIVSLISPFRADRDAARALFQPGEFIEVFVDTPLQVAEARDPKGLYAKARRGLITGFTGIDAPYEVPLRPEVHLQTQRASQEVSVSELLQLVLRHHTPGPS